MSKQATKKKGVFPTVVRIDAGQHVFIYQTDEHTVKECLGRIYADIANPALPLTMAHAAGDIRCIKSIYSFALG